jgi:RHS repeat-associated protein
VAYADGSWKLQVYAQGGQLLYTNHSSQGNTRHVYLGSRLIAEVNSLTGTSYSHTDALGSPVARTNSSGQVLSRTRYEPYGNTAAGTNPTGIGFTGHVNDADTGLVYMQQRYYEPIAGRFLSVDPVVTDGKDGSFFNRYVYANGNPYRFKDPDGRSGALALCGGGPVACGVGVAITAIVGVKAIIDTARTLNERQDNQQSDEPKISDREGGSDGKRGSTGGPGAGKRFPAESPEVRESKEGVPCRYCGKPTTNTPGQPNSRERDHIDPASRGGNNSQENEGDSCRTCNRGKSSKNPDEWKPKDQPPPEKPREQ